MNLKKTLAALLAGLVVGASMTVAASALEPHGTGIKMRKWLTNDPNYQFSEAYKTSVWYDNFSSFELGMNQRNNVLRAAVSQIGYHEGDSTADFHGMNTLGEGNFMEYGRLLVPNWNNNSFDWCACFVNWCLNQARFDLASSEISCGNWITELQSMEMWQSSAAYGGTYTPKPADFIFFDWDETGKWSEHIGLVLYTTDTHVFTIEGNTKTNDVGTRSYPLDSPQVLGYGTPPYQECGEPTLDYAYTSGMPLGTYIVNSPTAALTDHQGENPAVNVPLGSMVNLLEVDGDYALVFYNGQNGYLPKNILYLLTSEHTLTYDANGGTDAPSAVVEELGREFSISEHTPVLEGDVFLGWSTSPYHMRVDYRVGDVIKLSQDTTLYAVWEKRSPKLAAGAAAQGLFPAYERPSSIQNSAAILLGYLETEKLITDFQKTAIQFTKDDTAGRVLSFTSTGKEVTPSATIPYGEICRSLRLAPVSGKNSAYVILRVKDVQISHLSLWLTVNGRKLNEVALVPHRDWQYAVFDLRDSDVDANVNTLRLDWKSRTSAEGSQLLLADIYMANSTAMRDAVVNGHYVYTVQELLEVETEPETEAETVAETKPATKPTPETDPVTSTPQQPSTSPAVTTEVTTQESDPSEDTRDYETSNNSSDNTRDDTDGTEETKPQSDGCGSVIHASVWIGLILLFCLPMVFTEKKREKR